MEPAQNILRELNPRWTGQTPGSRISKFRLRKYYHDGVPYWSCLDLLGLLLSKLGPASIGATKTDFFLPLTAMYARWCRQLILNRSDLRPFMYQCTWKYPRPLDDRTRSDDGTPSHDGTPLDDVTPHTTPATFFLGASFGGCPRSDNLPWASVVQRARYRLANGEPITLLGWSFGRSPEIVNSKKVRIGNCAELYPFLHLLR